MKNTKNNLKLTPEEKAMNQYKILPQFNSFGEPTYHFKIGDEVVVGNLKDCVIASVMNMDNGLLVYGFTYDNNGTSSYMFTPWYNTRPKNHKQSETVFTQDDDIRISFYNTTVESLLNKFYLSGVDMNPEYQRDYVWTDEDKESLLDSIFSHIEIGKFAFIHHDYTSEHTYEILDGKQRLSTLLDFYENRFPYKGVYFNDLSGIDKYTFLQAHVAIGETQELSSKQIYKYFYILNKAGKTMDKNHLEKIKNSIGE